MCKACIERGKTWEGDEPKCAFPGLIFDENNWNCATLNQLRNIAESLDFIHHIDDCSLAIIPVKDEGWIVLSWYKSRGRTSKAIFMIDDMLEVLTLEMAEKAIIQYTYLVLDENN